MPVSGDHAPVLLKEALEGLAIRQDGSYLDGTYGRGGHTIAILERLGPQGRLLVIDRDPEAVAAARDRLASDRRVCIEQGNFAEMGAISTAAGFRDGFDGILLDLGVSSPQLDQASRGFSFSADGPLDMRMDPSQTLTAQGWLSTVTEREMVDVFRRYGEERFARRIAKALVRARQETQIETTGQLAEIVAAAVPGREPGKHPATRVFQAIRIRINDELQSLADGLAAAHGLLRIGGRLCVISFHSLEDRIVKRFIRDRAREAEAWRGLPLDSVPEHARPTFSIASKAIKPGTDEIQLNPRARSAVLRVAERIH